MAKRSTGLISQRGGNALSLAPETAGDLSRTQSGEKFRTVVVQAGVVPRSFEVTPGTTVKELLEASKVNAANCILTINSEKVDEMKVLTPTENILFVIPKPKNA